MTGKLTVVIGDFKPMRSNSLYGFVDVIVPELRLRIREATVHASHGRRWVGLPAKPHRDVNDPSITVFPAAKR